MSDLVLMMNVSIDGYFEGPGGDLGWQLVDDELHEHFNRRLAAASGFLDGRVTYELMAGFWPTADQDPAASPVVAEFARIWREMPKTVYSRTLQHAEWNTTIVRSVEKEEIIARKAAAPSGLVVGGAGLAAELRRLDLLDEYSIYVHPVVLGRGRPLFEPSDDRTDLVLAETRTFENGVALLRYLRR
ncbi:dihydrofolate reductase family protein [Streptomyces sp. TLI_171]|uniref:dihydrofolate reductase family protein n=1 Tax=Streptomyces sp. TLI_171 TaxID=1938859 RepID=UPI000C19E690|nr:dihydrofolate reductase family protein [Streptomyces sp. TLI_171]RKE17167.1 dihydrofolate reductase [Streptomyces sp. TLI_171]